MKSLIAAVGRQHWSTVVQMIALNKHYIIRSLDTLMSHTLHIQFHKVFLVLQVLYNLISCHLLPQRGISLLSAFMTIEAIVIVTGMASK